MENLVPDELKTQALDTLTNALITIRLATDYGNGKRPLSPETSALVGQVADCLHNVPAWLSGADIPEELIAPTLSKAAELIASLHARALRRL